MSRCYRRQMGKVHVRMLLAALATALAAAVAQPVPADADKPPRNRVEIHKLLNQLYDDETYFPDRLEPSYTTYGHVKVRRAVLTVRDNETGELIAYRKPFVLVDPGEYKVTTRVRYRTYRIVGYETRTVARAGDPLPGTSTLSTKQQVFVRRCVVTSTDLMSDPVVDETPPNQHGTFTASCIVRWGNLSGSVRTGLTEVAGDLDGGWDPGHDVMAWTYALPSGQGYSQLNDEPTAFYTPYGVDASRRVTHRFQIRDYSRLKLERATHIVRRLIH